MLLCLMFVCDSVRVCVLCVCVLCDQYTPCYDVCALEFLCLVGLLIVQHSGFDSKERGFVTSCDKAWSYRTTPHHSQ